MIKSFLKKYYRVAFGMIFGMLLTTSAVYAAYCVWAKDVGFTSSTGLASTNVQDAIDELNKKQRQCPVEEEEPQEDPIPEGTICVRATTLHTNDCEGGYCSNVGDTPLITYGNLGTKGNPLAVGDALDCDVNGDGTYDPETERFYYVTDSSTDNNYAVLIYYSNTFYSGNQFIVSQSGPPVAYNSEQYGNGTNFEGPSTAITYLPSTSIWSNVRLSNSTRNLRYLTSYNNGIESTKTFDYGDRAARLISYYDLDSCNASGFITQTNEAYLKSTCNFLMENTNYSGTGYFGYWTEDVFLGYNYPAAVTSQLKVAAKSGANSGASSYGTRPVIEVKKSDIYY